MNLKAPILVVFAGPNGAGKTTLYRHLLSESRLPWVNADQIALETGVDAYQAAAMAEEERHRLLAAGISFVMETVFSDPVGAKVDLLKRARASGYRVIVHFIGLDSAARSRVRVFQRVQEGGHDVPDDRINSRYHRVLENLRRLLGEVDDLTLYDNSSSTEPYRILARLQGRHLMEVSDTLPAWTQGLELSLFRIATTRILS